MLLGGDLEEGGERSLVPVHRWADPLSDLVVSVVFDDSGLKTYVLVDKEDGNVLTVLGELLECSLDNASLGLCRWLALHKERAGAGHGAQPITVQQPDTYCHPQR